MTREGTEGVTVAVMEGKKGEKQEGVCKFKRKHSEVSGGTAI